MQIWAELAVAENFAMDFTLLYAAKSAVKNSARVRRIAFASVLGAAFAVIFPIIKMPAAAAVAVKILSGFLICAVGGKFFSFKGYLKFSAAFMLLSALLAGAIYGVFSLFGLSYEEGGGFILTSVPVGLPLLGALIVIICAKKLAAKFSKGDKTQVSCVIFSGGKSAKVGAFFDSGNRVYLHGEPVSVIPLKVAQKLVDIGRINDEVKIHTVAGSQKIKVFTADKLQVSFGEKTQTYRAVKMGISPAEIDRAVLHPDLRED